jgi:probable phosphoglycerate mutase
MAKTLVIVRHGNTFTPEQIPKRVGRGTDIPLVEELKSRNAGKYLLQKNIIPDKVFAAPLKRTMKSAFLIIREMNLDLDIIPDYNFQEIDYGKDENKTEDQVKYRLGLEYLNRRKMSVDISENEIIGYGNVIINLWNTKSVVPSGWNVDVENIILTWINFATGINDGETALICTSNGIIRFAPSILNREDKENFGNKYDLKVATGSVSIFQNKGTAWKCLEWNGKEMNDDLNSSF